MKNLFLFQAFAFYTLSIALFIGGDDICFVAVQTLLATSSLFISLARR